MYKLKYIGPWVLPPRDLNAVRNVPKALLKAGRVACVYPEYPRVWRSVAGSVRVFDGELRLACL